MSTQKRRYELKARAELQEQTRNRIVAATVALHEEVGPAGTTIAEVARRAGVQRLTVYNHFPDERQLFAACQKHFLDQHPPPDVGDALAAADPADRLRAVLRSFYSRYRTTRAITENIQRDRLTMPALDALLRETNDKRVAGLTDALTEGFAAGEARTKNVRATVALALDFWTWRRLANEGLDDDAASELMVHAVKAAAEAIEAANPL